MAMTDGHAGADAGGTLEVMLPDGGDQHGSRDAADQARVQLNKATPAPRSSFGVMRFIDA